MAAAPLLALLTGAALLGPPWASPEPPAADSPSLEPRNPLVAAAVEPSGPLAAESSESTPAESESDPAEEVRTHPVRASERATADPVEITRAAVAGCSRRRAAGHGWRSCSRSAPPPAAPSSAAEPPAAPSALPSVPAAAPAPAPAPPLGAKNLYYAPPRPGSASSAWAEGAPVPVTPASFTNPGLKYRILRRTPDGAAVEVDADTLFQSGDRIRFAFEPNIDGFLYVIQRGSSGRWSVLLPHPQINGGHNAVARFGEVAVPPAGWFRFDENPGAEQVFVYLSRQPITALPWGGGPVVTAQSVDQPTVIELANSVRSRDLVFEKEDAPDGANQAAYVVNEGNLGNAVAWTVELNHR